MRRNTTYSDNIVLEKALDELRALLPASWRVDLAKRRASSSAPGAVVRVESPDRRVALLLVAVKRRLDPRDVGGVVSRFETYRRDVADAATPVVAAPYLGERTRQKLRARGAGYVDLTGNTYLCLDEPAVLIERQGAAVDPRRQERPARSLKGAKAGRLVRALVDFPPPLGTRQLGEITGIDAGYVSRLLSMLEREDLVSRRPRGPVERIDWVALLRQWARDYSLMASNEVVPFLQPRGLATLLDSLRRQAGLAARRRYAISGSLAAARRAPVAPARLAVVYVRRPDSAATGLGLVPAESGANVLLVRPFDTVVFERTVQEDGLDYVAPSQAAIDLLTSPGRGPEEAEVLIEWMQANERRWREQP